MIQSRHILQFSAVRSLKFFFPFLKILTTVVVFRQTNNFSRREKKKFLMASAGTDFEPKPLKEFPEKTSEVSVMEFRFF